MKLKASQAVDVLRAAGELLDDDAQARVAKAELVVGGARHLAGLPDGTPLDSAFDSMRTARLQEARSIRAQGLKQAQIIRAQADADAAKTYAASFGKDPQFYDFYRAMQSYQLTFVGNGQDKPASTTVILSPQNDYLTEFSGRSR